jgi:hypothetical protein
MTKTKELPLSPINGDTARDNSRYFARNPNSPDRYRECLRFVRGDCWNVPAVSPTAQHAWDNAVNKVAFNGGNLTSFVNSIPVGAPVFSRRINAADNDPGHVFIAGGWYKSKRLFRSVDIKAPGEVDACFITAFTEKWGHEILGWTKDLNGYALDFSKSNKR